MEESPPRPPVPPKDPGYQYQSSMDGSRPPTAQSGSKRKREAQDDTLYELRNGRLEVPDSDGHTPKRSRSARGVQSDGDVSTDETPMQQRNLRRKKGIRNLSNLNLRHAASLGNLPQRQTSPARESRFQEGSLNDKPSEKPPSVFTRFERSESGNLIQVDQLMEDYHDGMPMSADSVAATLEYENATRDQRVAEITASRQKKEEGSGIFRFGRSLAATFNPVSVWNKLWAEQKEELSRKAQEEAERKARKAEAEARYAQLKSTGQLGLKPVGVATPHDSAVTLNGGSTYREHQRNVSNGSVVRTSYDDIASQEGSEMPDSDVKQLRSSKSRLHLRRPSLQSLRGGLKRIGSVTNLVGATNRDSSSSVSPAKADIEGSALRKSHSKFDLKKQNRLSKRVSDLEVKLQKARGELEEALVQASPMPQLGNKYQRFTPSSTIRRPKFVPGALPTLPSERVLFPEQLGFRGDEEERVTQRMPRKALDLSTAFDDIDDEDEDMEDTPREKSHPARGVYEASSKATSDPYAGDQHDEPNMTSELTELTSEVEHTNGADPMTTAGGSAETTTEPTQHVANPDLDKKLKALNDNIKITKKSKSKKRSSKSFNDRTYRPSAGSEDDDDIDEQGTAAKKKRKSTGKTDTSPQNKRGKQKSPRGKAAVKKTQTRFSPDETERNDLPTATSYDQNNDVVMAGAEGSEDELAQIPSVRSSITSEDQLEPVYEEEEEMTTTTTTIPVKDVPSKPTAKATPARYMHTATRSRSNSPHKRNGPVKAATEEKMMMRAANAAQLKRTSRSRSPPPVNGYSKVEITNDVVKVVPGKGDVPNLPKGANGSFESLPEVEVEVVSKEKRSSKDDNYEWPDDVF
ncbi:hypothetical protein M409DRAFT_28266 [Zasmidium cellare ATCC 36951]|uniref:Nuclear RNA binding protein n=1 Tax=Zasmidium cellare ATCC 36951 TaxID=1080233 RepID=A0A6A6C289_ZASCE|nr:uncharacterized protein M409DRAFT_28266 [Zasmidium cellare ATCC 36951]KAF2161227.1 hypothetical protein M409DRAFT_28266 [Zasmidium cellare ATCC 36951]